MRKILVVPDEGDEAREYSLPHGVHVNVQEGDRVRAGEPLKTISTASGGADASRDSKDADVDRHCRACACA
jgi:hypothetical protein